MNLPHPYPEPARLLSRASARLAAKARGRGFTLVELVVVIVIVGTLSAIAVPRFFNLGRNARLATVKTLASTLRTTAENVRVLCKTRPECDYGVSSQMVTIAGRQAWVNYGWLDAGDILGVNQIDAWVHTSGFTASIPANSYTLFTLDGAPDPTTCSVAYHDAYYRGPAAGIDVVVSTGGC